jgi:bisphosphoglycerate-dependent phosphoglycerate mutase
MGVKTALAGITFTTGGKNQAVAVGNDLAGTMLDLQLECQEIINRMNYLVNNILTPAGGESANITTINAQITALS